MELGLFYLMHRFLDSQGLSFDFMLSPYFTAGCLPKQRQAERGPRELGARHVLKGAVGF